MLKLKENPVWRWYQRHDDVINLILTSTAELLPFGNVITKTIEFVEAGLTDKLEAEEEQKKQQAEQQIASLLTELKPYIIDLVEEIEYLPKYQKGMNQQDFKKTVLVGHIETEFNQVLPQLKQSMSKSIQQGQQRVVLDKRYELITEIGKGAQGVVYKARHLLSDNKCAIKLLPAELSRDTRAINKIQTEFKNMVNHLRHQFIVAYTEFGLDQKTGRYFLVMDYIQGQSLGELIDKRNQPFNIKEACLYLLPIAKALDFSHKKGFVHQDIKPDNILVNQQQECFLTDFGLASKISQTLTTLGRQSEENICGSRPYMAPEQYRGENPKAAADNWAFGVVLYEMLTGEMPFNGFDWGSFKEIICNDKPAVIEDIDIGQWRLLLELLAKERGERPSCLVDFLGELVGGKKKVEIKIEEEQIKSEIQEKYIDQYVIYNNGTVLDTNTNLMWKRCPEGLEGEECCNKKLFILKKSPIVYDWNTAVEKFKNISYAGYSDWRLPTIEELKTLVYCSNGTEQKKAWRKTCSGNGWSNEAFEKKPYQRPTINQQFFPNTVINNNNWYSYLYWSSSPYADDSNGSWSVDFFAGHDNSAERSSKLFVRLVRVGP